MDRKGLAPIIVLLVIVGSLVVGGMWYYEAHRSVSPQSASNPTSTTTNLASTTTTTPTATSSGASFHCPPGAMCVTPPTVPTSGWAAYTNSRYSFSFRYPRGLEVSDEGPYTSQSGTQPDSLDYIAIYSSSSLLFDIQVFGPGIVQGDYGWPERPCGEWTFGPDNGPIASQHILLAGEKTLYLVSREFGDYPATSSFAINDYYCVNYPTNPLVIGFNQAQAAQVQPILSTFKFSNPSASSTSL